MTDLNNNLTSNQPVKKLDSDGVFHSWSAQGSLDPLVIKSGSGCRLWDYEGREYLDFSSQLVNTNIGHQHPKVVSAIRAQLEELSTVAPAHANYARGLAAEKILARAPEGFHKVFFTNGGADANENAIRMARTITGRDKVLSSYRSYHGGTGSAIVATGDFRRVPNEYARAHVHFFTPYLYRSDFWAQNEEEESARALQHLRRVIEAEGPGSIAAILLETIPGTAGILTPPKGYLEGVRALADEFGIVLIFDEVMAGFGRTGKWLALDHFDVTPDLISFAKGVNSGYVPAGGVIISERISRYFDENMFFGGLTYSGHPLGMAAICGTLDAMEEEDIVGNAARIGSEVLAPGLKQIAEQHEVVGEVRGVGVFQAIELVEDRESRQPLNAKSMGQAKASMVESGLLPFVVANRIHVVPPCIVSVEEAKKGLSIISDVLGSIRR
ncbi:aspartate aminotransferase family protein [Halomonas icarae]|uniref:Aminotransferase class III-fold pyridoxal phosphate-dependent enzyme n=1 Tax=Halomonas icarae TaxID=2691040 RepID=A0A7X5ALI8_9GAMM|nr:aspartate aminotransferase family protein [Halomonas icarae]MDR5902896.1 aspartate aminotransferase family protein [Halomonas icarae]NAW12435.1 aminotransferase class III-fold pyridoxal phosphate-dependent enzyme [Halomonas icarae]